MFKGLTYNDNTIVVNNEHHYFPPPSGSLLTSSVTMATKAICYTAGLLDVQHDRHRRNVQWRVSFSQRTYVAILAYHCGKGLRMMDWRGASRPIIRQTHIIRGLCNTSLPSRRTKNIVVRDTYELG